jgi:NAD-dependent SIR2 family protein deacetylase
MPDKCPAELKRLYREGRVLPFVGAGASMSVSWMSEGNQFRGPSWREMVDEACRMLEYEDAELLRMRGSDLQVLEYFEHKKGNFAPLTNWLVRRLNAKDDDIKQSRIHTALAALENCSIYYTTNYDDFLERALSLAEREVRVVTSERDMGFAQKSVQVVKFHGDFNSPNKMVLSERHYYQRMKFDEPLDLKLRSDLLGRAAVFIGYSFSDMNVGLLFEQMNSSFFSLPNSDSGKRAYILAHNPSDFEFSLFQRRNITVIPVFGEDRTATTSEVLEDMAG